jgi:hypothetical protein
MQLLLTRPRRIDARWRSPTRKDIFYDSFMARFGRAEGAAAFAFFIFMVRRALCAPRLLLVIGCSPTLAQTAGDQLHGHPHLHVRHTLLL